MSKHTHVIEADTAEEFKSQVLALAATVGGVPMNAADVSEEVPSAPVASEGSKSKKGKKAPPPVEKQPDESSDDAAEDAGEEVGPEDGEEAVEEDLTEEAAPVEEADPFADDEEGGEEEKPKLTLKDVTAAAKELMEKKGAPALRATLEGFGVRNVNKVEAGKYGEFVSACKKALKAKAK